MGSSPVPATNFLLNSIMADDNTNQQPPVQPQPIPETDTEQRVRLIADIGFLVCAGLFGVILFGGGLYQLFIVKQPWLVDIFKYHFASLVIPPMSMVAAMVVIISLKVMSGPIKFKIFGFEFEGSSAPIIMWILVYLTIIHSASLLWADPGIAQNLITK